MTTTATHRTTTTRRTPAATAARAAARRASARTCASWAAESPVSRRRCTSPNAASAWRCSKRKHLGFGGSGRSGGQTIFGYASGQEKLEKARRRRRCTPHVGHRARGHEAAARADRPAFASTATTCAGHMHRRRQAASRRRAARRSRIAAHEIRLSQRAPRRATKSCARIVAERALHHAACTTPTAATCIPTSTRSGSARGRGARRRAHLRELLGDAARRSPQRRRRRQPRAHRGGHGARTATC